ncbi:TetR/AcrR family transcriptional regulator [Actinokineospora bangkokensis]|uniref:TetR/AcrR family transcriptional regulator n=1 Tax=Actinokineospora bangkokensis TaxID=1193682 RepID=UPI000AD6D055|nr:TetR/AcrR family transcriptional regulator [Actinokineospora bangkokensis]
MAGVPENPTGTAQRRRSDAARNHERILAAALDVVLEEGVGAPLDRIAKRAGVGNATVYRHFPSREALIRDLVLAAAVRTADTAEELAADAGADPVAALRAVLHRAADGRVSAVGSAAGEPPPVCAAEFAAANDRLVAALGRLLERGQRLGRLRGDARVEDVFLGLCKLSRPLPGTSATGVDVTAHRHLDILVDGLCATSPTPLVDAVDRVAPRGGAA